MYVVCLNDEECGWNMYMPDLNIDEATWYDCPVCGAPLVAHTLHYWLEKQSEQLRSSIAANAAAGAGGEREDGEVS